MAVINGIWERIVVNHQVQTAGKELFFQIACGGLRHFHLYGGIFSHKAGEQGRQDVGGKEIASPYRKMSGPEGLKVIQIIFKFIFHIHEMFHVMYVFFPALCKHDRAGASVKNGGSETGLNLFYGSA